MNNSHRTTAIAEGIYLYALIMNLSAKDDEEHTKRVIAWNEWCSKYPKSMQLFAINQQFKLFDTCNSKLDW